RKNSTTGTTTAACATGTYSGKHKGHYGSTTDCTLCPDGYKEGPGTTAQSNCTMNVPGGKHVSVPYASSSVFCGANTYKPSHPVKFGEKSDCVNCPSGQTSPAGSSSSSACTSPCTKKWVQNGQTSYRPEASHCSGVPTSLPSVNNYNVGDTISVCTSYKYYICKSWYQDPKPAGCTSRYYQSCASCGGLGDSLGPRAAKTPYILKCE
ncbi:MAG: hypothetical protein GX864_01345, partial [Mollicutes bacterium]|nr:hypothetical protein [Mollicutes bacterium]